MHTANSVMRDIWANVSVAGGDELTVNRDYLYYLLTELEKKQYSKGYHDGHKHAHEAHYKELASDLDFEGFKRKW